MYNDRHLRDQSILTSHYMSSRSYRSLLQKIDEIADENEIKDYRAFVYWFIKNTFRGLDRQKILDSICDGTHDKGVDAILVDTLDSRVTIIQSKFNRDGSSQIKESDIKLLATVKDYFKTRKSLQPILNTANEASRKLLNDALNAIRENFSLSLFFITTQKNLPGIERLMKNTYGFLPGEFSIWHHDYILHLSEEESRDFTPSLGPCILYYKEGDRTLIRTGGHKSWILSVPLENIRELVAKYGDNLFRKNVRNFLGSNRCSKGIQETLKTNPENFWYYNNGMCILCDEANLSIEENYIRLVNPQIINGCQTARSIERFKGDLEGDVLVRVIESKDYSFVNRITLYQNTSNPVKKRDLKSNDPIQVRLKTELKLNRWYFETKRGEDFAIMAKKYPSMKSQFKFDDRSKYRVISNEEVAKSLAALRLGPYIAVSKGSEDFFEDFYDDLFKENTTTTECLSPVLLHRIIKDTYNKKRRFHSFKNESSFKNPAGYYVLRFIVNAFGKSSKWQRQLISLYEDGKGIKKLQRSLKKHIVTYFELIYSAWLKSQVADYRTYLMGSETFSKLKEGYKNRLKALEKQLCNILTNNRILN